MEMKFYKCIHCGKIIAIIKDTAVPTVCCGDNMVELVPGTTDGAYEKHVPQFTVEGNTVTVKVGEAEHPMMPAHFIEWIMVQTNKGFSQKFLKPGEKPAAKFCLCPGEEVLAVYEYCNIHSLWKNAEK